SPRSPPTPPYRHRRPLRSQPPLPAHPACGLRPVPCCYSMTWLSSTHNSCRTPPPARQWPLPDTPSPSLSAPPRPHPHPQAGPPSVPRDSPQPARYYRPAAPGHCESSSHIPDKTPRKSTEPFSEPVLHSSFVTSTARPDRRIIPMLDQPTNRMPVRRTIRHLLPGRQRRHHPLAQQLQLRNLPLNLRQPLRKHIPHHGAGRMMIIRLLQNLPDLRQRKTQLPSLPGKPQPP